MEAVIWAMLVFGSQCGIFHLDPRSEFVDFYDGEHTTGDGVWIVLQNIHDNILTI
jgi:hypothetical protein